MQQRAVRRRSARWLIAALALSLLTVGVLATVSGAATPKPIVIGFVGAKTGFMSIYDQQVYVGAQVAADEANAKGGVFGGRKIKFITCDAKTNQAQGAVCAQQVLSNGADFVMPSCDFDFGSPAARVANKAGKVAIGCAGGLAYGVQGVGPLTYNTYSGSATEGAIMAEWSYKKMGWRHPYVITDTYLQYTKDVGTYFNKRWTQLAGKSSIVGQDTFNNTDASVAAQISRLRSAASKADFIVVSSLPPGGPSAIRQIRGAGINLPIVAAAAFDGSYWLSAVPKLSKFYYPALGSLYGDDPNAARGKLLYKDFKKVAHKPPSLASYPLLGYAAVQSLVDGMKVAHSTNGNAVAKALNAFKNKPLITGPTTYTAKCHIPSGRPYLIMQVQNGKPSYTGVTWKPTSVPPHPC
jgi:branched-chain amino acid transport system substrate-binding protein